MKYIIIGLIIFYALFVIIRKIKNIRRGRYCSCGCDDCPSKSKCKN